MKAIVKRHKRAIIGDLKNILKRRRLNSKATLKDIGIVLDWYINGMDTSYFIKVRETRLYNMHSGEYCVLLEVLNSDLDGILNKYV